MRSWASSFLSTPARTHADAENRWPGPLLASSSPNPVGAPCHTDDVVAWPEENELAAIDDRPVVRLVAHCRRCHGWLLSPQSVAEGIGPTCAIRERAESARRPRELTLFDVAA
ncbi:DUF6011 domain-containing protein [Nocardia beijingensis]|uniref:DUF6011 domain-containing protein n=1 Tax=Nocardia beijingensis TaxID=95162 RepID=UPI001E315F8A|nr:DUF6011 domain-containing protein [Nocardia beijingensis]